MRMLADQHLQLADQVGVAAERQVGLDPLLQCSDAQLLEASAFDLGERLAGELRQRGTAPQFECLAQQPRRSLGVRPPRVADQPLEAEQVDRLGIRAEQIAGRPRHERLGREQLAQPRHVDLDDRDRRLRRLIPPQLVDQPLTRDNPVRVQEQQREQRALLRTSQRKQPIALVDLERSEDPELHLQPPC
jgi:hypothetical protein